MKRGRRNNKFPGYCSISLGLFVCFLMFASIKLILIILALMFIAVGISVLRLI